MRSKIICIQFLVCDSEQLYIKSEQYAPGINSKYLTNRDFPSWHLFCSLHNTQFFFQVKPLLCFEATSNSPGAVL
jgi:hypothetical protein